MSSGPPQRSIEDIASAHPEVEFALVLARTIDSVASDPEHLRGAIYELARQKLQQLVHDDPSEKARLMRALEVAIAGVEAHSKAAKIGNLSIPSTAGLQPPRSSAMGARAAIDEPITSISADIPVSVARYGSGVDRDDDARKTLRWSSSTSVRYLTLLACLAAVFGGLLLQQRGLTIASLRMPSWPWSNLSPSSKDPAPPVSLVTTMVPPPEPKKSSLLPTAYGVYAESGGKLYGLEMLQGRAPDPRVAVSAAITKPSETVLPVGKIKFIVFRRDVGSGASDPIEVRVIARVKQATTFGPTGKPVVEPNDDIWVIRNISFPYRASPLKEDPQMFEIEGRDPDAALTPGRYALILKGQAFDFTVEGAVTDKRQCLERLAAANGQFYSECQQM